jgi:tetratricopeptide (TPR) repeat protein
MQNGFERAFYWLTCSAALLAIMLGVAGCAESGPKDKLTTAYQQLDGPNPNYIQIASAADEYLKENPTGPAAADALYLRGRALEAKSQRDPASPQRDSTDAYNCYTQALSQNPRPALEGLIHVGMGNILYFQDRYGAAASELSLGYEKLERDTDKAWALYRMGLCQQRLGKWAEADQTFAQVQQQFPNTEPAQRSRDHQGYNAFWVQVATFRTPQLATASMEELKKQGLTAKLFVDTTRNAQVVRIGPLTFDQANATKQRVLAKYRDAIIVP